MIIETKDTAYMVNENGLFIGEMPIETWEGRKLSPVMKRKLEISQKKEGLSLGEYIFLCSLRNDSRLWRKERGTI